MSMYTHRNSLTLSIPRNLSTASTSSGKLSIKLCLNSVLPLKIGYIFALPAGPKATCGISNGCIL